MREIKFRAWDVFYNKFVYSGDGEGALSNFFAKVAGGESAGREVPLMQFTGLKDKNGKEIYEGDILQYPSFEEGFGQIVIRNFVEDTYHAKSLSQLEVIGNIYENPELINSHE